MEQLNLSDAINLHPEIPVNTSCQRMETVDQEKGTAEPCKKIVQVLQNLQALSDKKQHDIHPSISMCERLNE